ncbi:MAG: hypothetical protein J7L88_02255, partial [Thermoplasmata archaeon]|nr:hypothetical protein [Thermoplasmata archaeon]
MKKERFVVLALILLAFLVLPVASAVFYNEKVEYSKEASQSENNFSGTVISTDERVKIVPLSPEEVPVAIRERYVNNLRASSLLTEQKFISKKEIKPVPISDSGMRLAGGYSLNEVLNQLSNEIRSEPIIEMEGVGSPYMVQATPSTRGTLNEQEPNDDDVNGTYISDKTGKTDVHGSFGTTTPQGQDEVDWYKIALDADSKPGGLITNLTLHLKSWQATGLQELIEPHPPFNTTADVNYDYIYIDVWHPYVIMSNYGGTEWYYDDFDDTNNYNESVKFREDWNLSVEAPHQSFGQLSQWDDDPYLEMGWYYIGISTVSIRAGQVSSSIPRQSYVLEVDPTIKVNGDQEAQDIYNSTAMPQNSGVLHLNNFYDHWDCFNITGSDPTAVWDINVTFEIKAMYWIPFTRGGNVVAFYYTWVYIYAYFIDYEKNIRWYTFFASDEHMLLSTPNPVYIH